MKPIVPVQPTDRRHGGADSRHADLWAVLAGLPVPVVVHDGVMTRFVNAAFTQSFGFTAEDIPTVAAWAERAYPDPTCRQQAWDRWWSEVEAQRATGKNTPPGEYRVCDKGGRQRDALFGFALHDDLVIVTVQDVTEVRAGEAALAAERSKTQLTAHALTENMPAGAYTMVLAPGEEVAKFAFVSRQFLEMLELTREEAVGDPATGFSRVHPEDRPDWVRANVDAFVRRAPFSKEARIIANGQTRWIRAESVPRTLEDGSIIWEGILVDITTLKETEQRLQTVINAARAYTWRRDLTTRRSEFDGNWARHAGHSPGERDMSAESWFRSVHPDDAAQVGAAVAALESGTTEKQIMTYRRRVRDDRWIWLQVHAGISARDADGRPTALSGVSFDITAEVEARNRAQEAQAQLREDLQRAQQRDTVAQVAGGVAHDLGNLIAVVAGTVEVLHRNADGQLGQLEALGRIRRAVDTARDLIAGLGGLVRPNSPREAHDLRRLMKDTVDLLGSRRIARHAVRVDLPAGPQPVWANPTELAQVIMNLALNACDSGAPDQIATARLSVLPAGAQPPQRRPDSGDPIPSDMPVSLFTVSDTGAGITNEVRTRMFRPSFTTKGKAGTGLGLLIVSNILQGNRAALWVDSLPGSGTTVTVAWPAEVPPVSEAGRSISETMGSDGAVPVSSQALAGLHVLVVDDLIQVAEVLADMLEGAGAIAFPESDPKEAQQVLAESPGLWSVLVTDLHMPDVDGRMLARFAASLSPPIPVVLVTARPETLGDAQMADFAAVLSKPVSAAQLARAVEAASKQRQAGAGHNRA